VRHVDLVPPQGLEADLLVDEAGLVVSYQHLFGSVAPPP
jgi:hypothetical protein